MVRLYLIMAPDQDENALRILDGILGNTKHNVFLSMTYYLQICGSYERKKS